MPSSPIWMEAVHVWFEMKPQYFISLQGGAEALVGFDVEQDSPYFDFRENPNKCRTAGKEK